MKYVAIRCDDFILLKLDVFWHKPKKSYGERRSDISVNLNFGYETTEYHQVIRIPYLDLRVVRYNGRDAYKCKIPNGSITFQKALLDKEVPVRYHHVRTSPTKYSGGLYVGSNISRPYSGGLVSSK